jgi:hypothetical protein
LSMSVMAGNSEIAADPLTNSTHSSRGSNSHNSHRSVLNLLGMD